MASSVVNLQVYIYTLIYMPIRRRMNIYESTLGVGEDVHSLTLYLAIIVVCVDFYILKFRETKSSFLLIDFGGKVVIAPPSTQVSDKLTRGLKR